MIYAYNPAYVDSFQALLENLQVHRQNLLLGGGALAPGTESAASHLAPPENNNNNGGRQQEDERAIQGAAHAEIDKMYERVEDTKMPLSDEAG